MSLVLAALVYLLLLAMTYQANVDASTYSSKLSHVIRYSNPFIAGLYFIGVGLVIFYNFYSPKELRGDVISEIESYIEETIEPELLYAARQLVGKKHSDEVFNHFLNSLDELNTELQAHEDAIEELKNL